MTTVTQIAQKAFNVAQAKLPDAVHNATLSDGVTDYTCRVVEDYKSPAGAFPKKMDVDGARTAYVEGLTAAPQAGWSLTYAGAERLILWPSDVAAAGGLYVVYVIPRAEWLNTTVEFTRGTSIKNNKGEFDTTWAVIAGAPTLAAVRAQSIAEQANLGRVVERGVQIVTVPYFAGLTTADRLTIGSEEYNIRAVDDIERRNVWWRIEAAKGEQS